MAKGLSTSAAVQIVVKGLPELLASMERLGTRVSRAAANKALRAGMKPVTAAIRKNSKTMVKRKTGALQKSVGARIVKNKNKGYIFQAVTGFNVGKTIKGERTTKTGRTVKAGRVAPHSHLIALGTKMRKRETPKVFGNLIRDPSEEQKSTGQIARKTPVVPLAYAQSKAASLSAMKSKLVQEINRETIKARKRGK